VVAVLGLFLLHQIISVLELLGDSVKKILSGKPSLVINRQGVDLKELKRNNMGVEDLIESMRSCGYFSLDDVEYAIFESNGKLSALEKNQKPYSSPSLPLLLISDGKINPKNLELINAERQTVIEYLQSRNFNLKNTEVLTVDGNGRSYFKYKNRKYEIFDFPLKENVKW
jgi:uncharacterized membrane protein YcaP (DUF421 family)